MQPCRFRSIRRGCSANSRPSPRFTDAEPSSEGTAVTRIVFSADDLRARAWLKDLASAEGFAIREDAVGNIFIRWAGTEPDLPAVATGSHTDAIPHAGMYDGTVGVLGGLEAMRALKRSGLRPRRSIELVMFTSEEPTRFGIGCLGSRLLSGTLDPDRADALQDKDGRSHSSRTSAPPQASPDRSPPCACRRITTTPGSSCTSSRAPCSSAKAFPLGIVTSIAAPAGYRFTITGFGGHAGALLMPDRKDALCAAAELILSIEKHALATGAIDTVATVGTCDVHPGAVNSVPSRVVLQLDIRDTDPDRREAVMQAVRRDCEELRQRRKCHDHRRAGQRRRSRAILPAHRRSFSKQICDGARHPIQKNGQPRLSRLALHGPHRAHRHDLHPLPQRRQPPAGRIRRAGRYRSWARASSPQPLLS